jgi:hypothetical protein
MAPIGPSLLWRWAWAWEGTNMQRVEANIDKYFDIPFSIMGNPKNKKKDRRPA